MQATLEIGDVLPCPSEVADSREVVIVGHEPNLGGGRLKVKGGGATIYHACESVRGERIVGKPSFHVGSNEAAAWLLAGAAKKS
jgi:hypothetical protein